MRIILYIIAFYFIYRLIRYILTRYTQKEQIQKEYYTIDEYGSLRKEKDITNEVRIINEKKLNE